MILKQKKSNEIRFFYQKMNFFSFLYYSHFLKIIYMERPHQMDKIVGIMTRARDQNRRLSNDEAKQLDVLLHNMFHSN